MWALFEVLLLGVSVMSTAAFALSVPQQTGVSSRSCLESFGGNRQRTLNFSTNDFYEEGNEKVTEDTTIQSCQRRELLGGLIGVAGGLLTSFSGPSVANAGEVGARITKAVTTSDLGISVRTSVVKGAQMADKIDGQWEKFSDKYGLGSKRTNQQVSKRPNDKKIPDPLPLNIDTAQKILDVSDEVFLKLMPTLSQQRLTASIEKVAKLSMPSFERSGVVFPVVDDTSSTSTIESLGASFMRFETAPQFNFVVYAHFKAYSDLILEKGSSIDFGNFRSEFERGVGQRLIETFRLADVTKKESRDQQEINSVLKNQLLVALEQTDTFGRRLRELGLVANVDRNSVESNYDLQDFVDDALSDLVITLSVDGDATLQSQMLLQEQGYRLYPNFNRFVVTELFRQAVQTKVSSSLSLASAQDGSRKVSVMDYYFDTNYNSDPDKFEVRQVLLNISIE